MGPKKLFKLRGDVAEAGEGDVDVEPGWADDEFFPDFELFGLEGAFP